jgi:hypothetical protein
MLHHLQNIPIHILVGFAKVTCLHCDIYIYSFYSKSYTVNFVFAESDSDSEDTEGVYYSVYENRQRHRQKQQLKGSNQLGQSTVTVTLSVSQGVISLFAPVRVCNPC